MRRLRNLISSGFTLIEVVLYIAVVTLLVGILGYFYLSVTTLDVKQEGIKSVEDSARLIIQEFQSAGDLADGITIPAIAGTGIGGTGSDLSLSSATASLDPIVFDVVGADLTITRGLGSTQTINTSDTAVDSITFRSMASGSYEQFEYDFVISYKTSSTQSQYQRRYQGLVNLRQ